MTTRGLIEPLSPISPNIIGAKYSLDNTTTTAAAFSSQPAATSNKTSTFTTINRNTATRPLFEKSNATYTMAERVMDDVTTNTNTTHTSNSESLPGSSLTGLDDDTDDFGRLIIAQAREERAARPQAFRKARTRPLGLTLENLERKERAEGGALGGRNGSGSGSGSIGPGEGSIKSIGSKGSGSVEGDDRQRRVREWGRKGRRNTDWLRRIAEPSTAQEAGSQRALSASTNVDNGIHAVDWLDTAADVPLPPMDDSPLSQKAKTATPGSIKRLNDSLDRIHEWEMTDDDFSGSIIASTPAVWRKNTKLDDIRQRELEVLKEAGVATQRLDRIREADPEERVRPHSSGRRSTASRHSNEGEALAQSCSHPADQNLSSPKRTPSRRSTNGTAASVKIAAPRVDTAIASPVVVYKSSQTIGYVDQAIQGKGQTSPQRPNHRRQDSQDLLRRLARVTSATPSPKSDQDKSLIPRIARDNKLNSPLAKGKEREGTVVKQESSGLRKRDSIIGPASTILDAEDTGPKNSKVEPSSQKTLDKPVINDLDEITDIQLPFQTAPMETIQETPKNPKTPVITGAWVDTPAPQTGRRSQFPSLIPVSSNRNTSPVKSIQGSKPESKEPTGIPKVLDFAHEIKSEDVTQPSSALAAVVNRAKSKTTEDGDDTIGESTINSLEELLFTHIKTEDSGDDVTATLDLDDDTLLGLKPMTGTPKTAAERQRQAELHQLQNMNARLRAARTSIRDASRGMRRVENQVDENQAHEKEHHASITDGCKRCTCEECEANAHTGIFTAMGKSILSLFWRPKHHVETETPASWWAQFTWLGLLVVCFWVWFITEVTLSQMLCPPRYATYMKDYGVDPDAPEPPYVTITVLSRPFTFIWRPLFILVKWIVQIVSTAIFSEEQNDAARRTASKAVYNAARASVTAVAQEMGWQHGVEDWSMSNDELL